MPRSVGIIPPKERPAVRKSLRKLAMSIQSERMAAGLTQEQLAEKIGVAANTIAKLETDARIPSVPMLILIAKALKTKIILE